MAWVDPGTSPARRRTTLCSLGLPPHVGRGDAAVVRPTRSESFFDLITNKITKLPLCHRVGKLRARPRAGLRPPSIILSLHGNRGRARRKPFR